jgi:transcription antitermination factor NusG
LHFFGEKFTASVLDLAELCPLTFSDAELPLRQSTIVPDECAWFAIHTRTRFEKKVASQLQEKRIETFLPLFSARHKWNDRRQIVHEPLFPGYVFVRIPAMLDTRIAVLRTIGVMNFVGCRGMGTSIPASEIQAIKTVLEQRVPFLLYPYMNVGQRVRIRGGCFEGIEGILTAINGDDSLVISVDLIQRSIALRITGYHIEPASPIRPIQGSKSVSQEGLSLASHDGACQSDARSPLRVQ